MAVSTKGLSADNSSMDGEWTVVSRRHRRKQKNNSIKSQTEEEGQRPWAPRELEPDPGRKSKLMQKLENSMKKLESSRFYATFLDQIQTPEILERFRKLSGSDSKLQMVIYGIGSIESYETPRFQLSLAMLMKKNFSWIGEVEVFDPVLSATEIQVLAELGCTVLSVDEQGRRVAGNPMLFFMPHCEAELYNNLLQANWRADTLMKIALFGNSFQAYESHVCVWKDSPVARSSKYILAARGFADEFDVKTVSADFYPAFHDSSWHFFCPDPASELPLVDS